MSKIRIIGYSLLGLIIAISILIAALPSIASTELGKNVLLSLVNNFTELNIKADTLHLSWTGRQHIGGLAIKDYSNGSTIECKILEIEAPLWKILTKKIDLGHIEVSQLNARLQSSIQQIDLVDVNLQSDLGSKDKPLSFHASGKTVQNNLEGFFQLDFSLPYIDISTWEEAQEELKKLFTIEGSKSIDFKGEVVNFPVALLNQLTRQPIDDIFGDYFNLKLNKKSDPSHILFTVNFFSPHLIGEIEGMLDNDRLTLQKPAIITWTAPPQLFKENFQVKVELENLLLSLQKNTPSQINLKALFPVPPQQSAWGKNAEINLQANILSLNDIKIDAKIQTETLSIAPIHIVLEGKSLKSTFSLPSHPFLGSPSDITIHIDQHDSYSFSTKLRSALLDLKMYGKISDTAIDMEPIQLNYKLTNEALRYIESPLQMEKNSNIHVSTEPFKFIFNPLDLNQLDIRGTISTPEIALGETFETQPIFHEISIPWVINGSINQIQFMPSAKLTLNNNKTNADLSAQLVLHDWLRDNKIVLNEAKIEAFTNLFTFPTSILNSYISDQNLTPLLGSMVDIQLITLIDPKAKSAGYIDMDINTQHLHSTIRLQIDRTMVSALPNNTAQKFRFTLTPEGFTSLKTLFPNRLKSSLDLTSPVTFKGSISKLSIPFDKPKEGLVQVQLNSDEIKLNDRENPTPLEPIQISMNLNSTRIGNEINLKTHLSSKSSTDLLHLDTSIQNLSNLTVNLSTKEFPTQWIPALMTIDPNHQHYIKGVIGTKVNTSGEGQFSQDQGIFSIAIDGNRGKVSLSSQFKNGTLILLKPIECELIYSPDLINQKNSLLNNIVGAEQPLKLTIDPKGFSLPLPFDIKTIKMGRGILNLGKIRVKNDGEVKRITSLLKPIPGSEFMLWFTPIYFNLGKGNLSLERFDLLVADQYPMAAWGDIQLSPLNINAVVGIGGPALKYAFGVDGLDESYLLKVPIHGNQDKISVDYPKATARISALVAQMQANPHLKLVGAIMELLGGDLDSKPPAPTTQPFPWDKGTRAKPQEQQKGKSKEQKIIDNLEEGASSLLNHFLKPKGKK